jgi:hypothetical protein
MPGLHISDFTAIVGNPAKQFMWEVLIPALPVSSIKALSTQFPGVGSTDIDLYHLGQLAKFPGTVEYEHTWTCSIVESESGDVFNAMYEWKQLIHDQKTGVQQDVAAFKRDITLTMITSVESPWAKIVLKQAYPKSIDTVELDKSANTEAFKWNLVFNYDWWEKV